MLEETIVKEMSRLTSRACCTHAKSCCEFQYFEGACCVFRYLVRNMLVLLMFYHQLSCLCFVDYLRLLCSSLSVVSEIGFHYDV